MIMFFIYSIADENTQINNYYFTGNHGEDVKECYYYLDSTPTHSYMKALYKYPQNEYPYSWLVNENRRRSRQEPEFELEDTGERRVLLSLYYYQSPLLSVMHPTLPFEGGLRQRTVAYFPVLNRFCLHCPG